MAVKTKAPKATKAASKKKAAPPPKPVVEEESSEEEEEDDSSEEEAVPVKQAKVAEEDDSDEESEDEESEEEANGKGADSDEEEEDSDEEEAVAAEEDSDDEEEEDSDEGDDEEMEEGSDDDSDEEESKPVKRKAAAAKEPAKKKAKKEAGSDSEEESEEESEAEEESDEEESNDSEEPKSFFVGSLPSAWGEEELRKFFKTNHVKVSRCSKREGKMFGHVDAAPADEEKIMKLNGKQVEGSAIKVDVAGGGKSADGGAQVDRFADERKRTVFVRNMDWNLSDHDIKEHFAGCDSVSMPLRDDGKPKGFAFVVFPTEDACDKAIADNNGVALGERELACSKASDRPAGGTPRGGARGGRGDFGGRGRGGRGGRGGGTGDGAPSKKLFIKNLDFGVTSETLGGYFEGATNCHVATDRETGQSRGFAFVEFDSVDNAKEAFNGAKGAQIEGRDIFLDFAQDREREGGGRGGGRGGGGRGFGGGRGGGGRGFGGGRGGGRGRGSFFEGQGKRKSFDD